MSEFGLVLLVIGAALAVAEAHVPSYGALGAAAVAAIAAGAALVIAGAGLGLTFALAAGSRRAPSARATCGSSCARRSRPATRACAAGPRA